ncbi:MAG: hypothetical protein O6927_02155 [Gammaproteobacteria bacterium]|nr:hypothetical protein [Gammaproteobacteria bacterium]
MSGPKSFIALPWLSSAISGSAFAGDATTRAQIFLSALEGICHHV